MKKSGWIKKLWEIAKVWLRLILNWRFLVCFGIGWMITNGWSYILLGIGVFWEIEWMVWLSGGYLALIWFPFSPEKIITVGIAIFLAHKLFPAHTGALVAQIKMTARKGKKKLLKRIKKMMKKLNLKYRLVIFDLDGTLLDTLEDLYVSVNYALKQAEFPLRTKDEVKSFVGNGARNLITLALPKGVSEETCAEVYEIFAAHYAAHCFDQTGPYDGIFELLTGLHEAGILLAVVSNKDDAAVKPLCDRYFNGLLDVAVGRRDGVRKKPAPDTVNEVLELLQVERSDAVYVGDMDVDIETAKNAELPCISVTWGFRDPNFLHKHGAKIMVCSPDELLQQLKR